MPQTRKRPKSSARNQLESTLFQLTKNAADPNALRDITSTIVAMVEDLEAGQEDAANERQSIIARVEAMEDAVKSFPTAAELARTVDLFWGNPDSRIVGVLDELKTLQALFATFQVGQMRVLMAVYTLIGFAILIMTMVMVLYVF